ncbi:hypothetical protein Fot_35213 [Forsythia ovata]|uniref:Uncharacterized protein n=1 Tax=Forsythia ovata TaxID=205694 RepID=A0ABD1SKW3_9LAMI
MNDNDGYTFFFDAINVLGEPSKFSMSKMQKYSEKGNYVDHVEQINALLEGCSQSEARFVDKLTGMMKEEIHDQKMVRSVDVEQRLGRPMDKGKAPIPSYRT